MHRQINVGCSREELHTSIGIPFFYFAAPVASDVGLFQWIVEKAGGSCFLEAHRGATSSQVASNNKDR